MRALTDYHHFRRDAIQPTDRVALCERRVIDMLLTTALPDARRESSIAFELKHHHSVAQLGRILARKRVLPLDVCTVGALLHDVHVIQHGTYANHAHLGAPQALDILRDIGGFTAAELEQVHTIVYYHSDKDVWSRDSLAEFGKDADVLDCFLYPGAFDYYMRHKSLASFAQYLRRAKKVWAEVGMPADPRFDVLDGFHEHWFTQRVVLSFDSGRAIQALLERLIALGRAETLPPAYAVSVRPDGLEIATNAELWAEFVSQSGDVAGALAESGHLSTDSMHRILLFDERELVRLADGPGPDGGNALPLDDLADETVVVWPLLGAYERLSNRDTAAHHLDALGLRRTGVAQDPSNPDR
jgi:hypothetical protein